MPRSTNARGTSRPWQDLFERLPESVQSEVSARADRTIAAIRLAELRRALGHTQHDVAAALNVAQSEVSRQERRRDLHIGTLSRYAAALGGRLELRITFPDGTSVDIAESSEDAA